MTEGYYVNRQEKKKATRYYSKKQEKKVARTTKGKVVANSGATPFFKGDVTNEDFLFECKTKTVPCKSVSIYKHWLEKAKEEAFAMNKPYSALVFDFGDGENYFIIDEKTFIVVNDLLRKENT